MDTPWGIFQSLYNEIFREWRMVLFDLEHAVVAPKGNLIGSTVTAKPCITSDAMFTTFFFLGNYI